MPVEQLERLTRGKDFARILESIPLNNHPDVSFFSPSRGTKREDFVGAVWQMIAQDYVLKNLVHNDRSYIDPKATIDFYRKLYGKQITHHPFGGLGLENTVVPDALLVHRRWVQKPLIVLEWTAARFPRHFIDKYKAFRRVKEQFPMIFYETELLFIVPKDAQIPERAQGKDVKKEMIPYCDSKELAAFINYLIENFSSVNTALLGIHG